MALLRSGQKRESLGVLWMAAALAGAAFLGASMGMIWHSAGFGNDEPEPKAGAPADPEG